jgi:hypothetical protein
MRLKFPIFKYMLVLCGTSTYFTCISSVDTVKKLESLVYDTCVLEIRYLTADFFILLIFINIGYNMNVKVKLEVHAVVLFLFCCRNT